MSESPENDLEEEARALLRPAREPLPAPAELKARALRRMDLALSLGAGGSSGPDVAPPTPPGPGAGALGRLLLKRVPAWSLLASFVAGGALAIVSTRPAPEPVPPRPSPSPVAAALPSATTAVPAPAVSSAPMETSPPPTASVPSVAREPSPTRPPASVSARAGSDGGLEAERALLDVARTALGRGDGSNALRAADEHARRFPHGILAEEREAMSIQALRLLHREDEAGARLDRFRGRFPTSLIRPALEATDGGSP